MHSKLKKFKKVLKKEIEEYSEQPVTTTNLEVMNLLLKCYEQISLVSKDCGDMPIDTGNKELLTDQDISSWNAHMINDDGTHGGKWTVSQTTEVSKKISAEMSDVSEKCFNVTMNMMYSDYCMVGERMGVDIPDFYAHLANKFLHDKDGGTPEEKLAKYYHCVVR